MRFPILCAFTLLAGGCALPVPLQLATFAASGFSYATTGKGISDHAVSAVAEQDCAMHRIAFGEEMCNGEPSTGAVVVENAPTKTDPGRAEPTERLRDSMVALATSTDNSQGTAPDTPQFTNALAAIADTLNKTGGVKDPVAALDSQDAKNYLVIGHYKAFEDAEKIRTRHVTLRTKIRMVLHEGALLYRVTAGPFRQTDALDIEANIGKSAFFTRIAKICGDHPCSDDAYQLTARTY